jgi:uncharacterized CHY-type Zn-finger protein
MAVEKILLKIVYCGACGRFMTVLIDTLKCPKCGNGFQFGAVEHVVKKVRRWEH